MASNDTSEPAMVTSAQIRKFNAAQDKRDIIVALKKLHARVTDSYYSRDILYVTFEFGKGKSVTMNALKTLLNTASQGLPFVLTVPYGDTDKPGVYSAKYLYHGGNSE